LKQDSRKSLQIFHAGFRKLPSMSTNKRHYWRSAGLFSLGFMSWLLSACAPLDLRLRQAVFRPTPATQAELALLPKDVQVYFVPAGSSDGKISLYWFPSPHANSPTLLYLHGVYRHAIQNAPKIESIRASGWNVLAVDYRGWGLSSTEVPSEDTINQDALKAFDELIKKEPQAQRRAIFGHSMGGAAAIALAKSVGDSQFSLLALESTFASTSSLMRSSRWYGFLLAPVVGDAFNSLEALPTIGRPMSMMHGAQDQTVPIEQGRKLHAVSRPGTPFEVFETGRHSDLHTADPERYRRYWARLRQGLTP
jgi:uncharacterized protein